MTDVHFVCEATPKCDMHYTIEHKNTRWSFSQNQTWHWCSDCHP